jgi:pimeloyl-ACP methyl ester carboxylesterase
MNRILYLHGFASGPSSSKAQFFKKRLEAGGAQVEIPALDGGDFEHLTLTGQLAIIEKTAAGDAISVMGSSMGGYLAAIYAARHSEVRKVVLLAPAFGFARRWEIAHQWRTEGSMEFFHYAEGRNRRVGYQLMEDAFRYEDYPDFHQPALIFHGEHDDVVPVSLSHEFAASHPNAELEVMDSDHQLLEVLEHMAGKVSRFLLQSVAGPAD